MSEPGVDPLLLRAWLAGRSLARGVPQPIADRGGFRVDSNTEAETSRWVFPRVCPGLSELAMSIRKPRVFLKLCGEADMLRSVLPGGWTIGDDAFFMQAAGVHFDSPIVTGYHAETSRTGAVIEAKFWAADGSLAASGYAGETNDAFVYDRIVTSLDHRRRGLGRAVMAVLQRARRNRDRPELLVATAIGRSLYEKLGWRTTSTYSTASILPKDGALTA